MRVLTYEQYKDKVWGGWIGKCAGGILGAPIEGVKRFNNIQLSEKLFETNFPNDDLDLQILWLDMVKKKGPQVRESDFAEHWLNHCDFPWSEYGVAFRNLRLGVFGPASGYHNNWFWQEGMGCPIRSEIWGMLCPGMMEEAARYAEMDATVDHDLFSVDAEKFLSAIAAEAFFDSNIESLLRKGQAMFAPNSKIYQMVDIVMEWSAKHDMKLAMHKIKSKYGDADFTAAPMNIAFTLLTLLKSNNEFSYIMPALHMGHDSDCIVATAAALLGIINGYSGIDKQWKELVGNEVLVSAELTGFEHTNTISGLTDETCEVGIAFVEHLSSGQVALTEVPATNFNFATKPLHVNAFIAKEYSVEGLRDWQELTVEVESFDYEGKAQLTLNSELIEFESNQFTVDLSLESSLVAGVRYRLKGDIADLSTQKISYQVTVDFAGKQETIERGLPYYGQWLLAGPFIEDDPDIAPLRKDYPDHGLTTMPSWKYMNTDKLNREKEFVNRAQLADVVSNNSLEEQEFLAQYIYPDKHKVDLTKYYEGRGQKTVYLYSQVEAESEINKWLILGCSAYARVWLNGDLVINQSEIERCWPEQNTVEVSFNKGKNDILIRLDLPTDEYAFEFAIKEHPGKHPHQCQWDVELVPSL